MNPFKSVARLQREKERYNRLERLSKQLIRGHAFEFLNESEASIARCKKCGQWYQSSTVTRTLEMIKKKSTECPGTIEEQEARELTKFLEGIL